MQILLTEEEYKLLLNKSPNSKVMTENELYNYFIKLPNFDFGPATIQSMLKYFKQDEIFICKGDATRF